mgnify:FL=1
MSSPEIDAPAQLTPEAKQLLSATVRGLRQRLLRDLRDSAEREYRLAVPLAKAGLGEAQRVRRQRLEHWLDERVRTAAPRGDKEQDAARERFFLSALKEAAATWLNRLFFLRHLEARGLSRPLVVTGGWNSKGYRELREFAPGLTHD